MLTLTENQHDRINDDNDTNTLEERDQYQKKGAGGGELITKKIENTKQHKIHGRSYTNIM